MTVHKTYFDRWWKMNTKHIGLYNYKAPWKEIGQKPIWRIRTNGASRKNGGTCFVLTIFLGYIVFNYTKWLRMALIRQTNSRVSRYRDH